MIRIKYSLSKMMYSLYLLFCLMAESMTRVSSSSCLIHDKCFDGLRTFTQADDFYIYTSIDEAEAACSVAKDAYLCVMSAPQCRSPSEAARYSPVLRGSSRLLNEFCGFRARRRPCCALRTAYLEHSTCYAEVRRKLNDCNDKYRASLDMILGMEEEAEQNEQRFCSLQWFGNCVKSATQKHCGKVAAQVIRSYVMKAGQHHKTFVQRNEFCKKTLYGYEKVPYNLCQPKRFEYCHAHLQFIKVFENGDQMTEEETFVSICSGMHDSLECLIRAFKRCLLNTQSRKFERMELETGNEVEKNNVCLAKEGSFQRYHKSVYCIAEHIPELDRCKEEFGNPAKYSAHTMPHRYYYQYFCASVTKLERCFSTVSRGKCGLAGKAVMNDILQMAAVNVHRKCDD